MNFEMLCNIILEGKKTDRYARLVIGNATPIFTVNDVLRDPNDPSKGLMTYLSHRDTKAGQTVEPERLARRALRRLNWVAKSAIKKLGNREISLEKLNQFIVDLLERYQTKVLGYEKPDKMNTMYEARVIGNLLLPPTKRTPDAKGVFVAVQQPKVPGMKDAPKDPEELSAQFNASVDSNIVVYDPDLLDTIKEIASEGPAVTMDVILKDPRIRGVYEPRVVRKVTQSMIDMQTLMQDEAGNIMPFEKEETEPEENDLPPESELDLDTKEDARRLAIALGDDEEAPPVEDEIEDDEDDEDEDDEEDENKKLPKGKIDRFDPRNIGRRLSSFSRYAPSDEAEEWY